jgi:hypothetical protein
MADTLRDRDETQAWHKEISIRWWMMVGQLPEVLVRACAVSPDSGSAGLF